MIVAARYKRLCPPSRIHLQEPQYTYTEIPIYRGDRLIATDRIRRPVTPLPEPAILPGHVHTVCGCGEVLGNVPQDLWDAYEKNIEKHPCACAYLKPILVERRTL